MATTTALVTDFKKICAWYEAHLSRDGAVTKGKIHRVVEGPRWAQCIFDDARLEVIDDPDDRWTPKGAVDTPREI